MNIQFSLKNDKTFFTLGDLYIGDTFRFAQNEGEDDVRLVIKRNNDNTSNIFSLNHGLITSCVPHETEVFVVEGTFIVTKIRKEK